MCPAFEEVHRGLFSIPHAVPERAWRHHFPAHAHFNREEGVIQVAPTQVAGIAEALRQSGYKVATLAEEAAALSKYSPRPLPDTRFTALPIPPEFASLANTEFFGFSFTTRRLRELRPRQHDGQRCLFVRLGQPVVVRTNKQNRATLVAEASGLRRQEDVQGALEQAHRSSRLVKVYYVLAGDYLFLYRPLVYLPPKHYRLLFEKLGIFAGPEHRKEFSEKDTTTLSPSDLPLIQQILGTLSIELAEGEPPEKRYRRGLEAVEQASQVLRDSYWDLFSSQDEHAQAVRIIRRCEWENVEKETLASALTEISNRAFDGDSACIRLLGYFQFGLPVAINYKLMQAAGGEPILRGLTVEQFRTLGPEDRRYYLCALPDLHVLLQVATKQDLGRNRSAPTFWVADQWHAFPYFGRFKFTSRTTIAQQRASIEDILQMFISRSYGIPTVEQRLAEEVYLASFFQDRNPQHWVGALEFTRYFAGFGKLLIRQTGEMDAPTALMEDVSGKPFFLRYGVENYLAQEEEISLGEEGRWKRFLAASFLIRKLRDPGDVPVFDMLPRIRPKDVGWDLILDGTVLALAKYHGFVTEEMARSLITHNDLSRRDIQGAIRRALSAGKIVTEGERFYYSLCVQAGRPLCLTQQEERAKEAKDAQAPGLLGLFNLFRPIIHPLAFGQPVAVQGKPTESERLLLEARQRIRRPCDFYRQVSQQVLEFLQKTFKERGVVHLVGPKTRCQFVYERIFPKLEEVEPENRIHVYRKDRVIENRDVTEFIVWSERLLWRNHVAHSLTKRGWRVDLDRR